MLLDLFLFLFQEGPTTPPTCFTARDVVLFTFSTHLLTAVWIISSIVLSRRKDQIDQDLFD